MEEKTKKELVIKAALEVLQNALPTNIVENLAKLDKNYISGEHRDDLDEERFIFEHLSRKVNKTDPSNELATNEVIKSITATDPIDSIDPNISLTYFEIMEQEMMQSLPVSKENVTVLKYILSDFPEIDSSTLEYLKLRTFDQLTNLLVYALMTSERSDETEQLLSLEPGTVNNVLETLCNIIADKKYAFVHWPNRVEIEQNVRMFENYHEYGQYEFYNVFGAIGTIDIRVRPALPEYLSVKESTNRTYTPVKWQCSCDTGGILQSSLVHIPKQENESKNSYVFEVNPVKILLESMKSDEMYLVADETLTIFPFLLTPHEQILIQSEEHNQALESKRKVIDKTFDHIQKRFLILNRIELTNVKNVIDIVETVGILHNFFMVHHDLLYIDEYDAII